MNNKDFLTTFTKFIESCPVETLDEDKKYVFLSDLHMGDGGSRDDLAHNRSLIEGMFEHWYLPQNYSVILNGDIEELSKFRLPNIQRAWPRLYEFFSILHANNQLRKIVGNHDITLLAEDRYPFPVHNGLVLSHKQEKLCVFHGHQASTIYVRFNHISDFLIRHIVKPLHIKNTGVSKNSRRRYTIEKRVYWASKKLGIVGITGHTHRPLFESLSKYDNIKFTVEKLLGMYPNETEPRQKEIEKEIAMLRQEMKTLLRGEKKIRKKQSLYGKSPFLIPCLFNSGCATGKHGITCLEIEKGTISLVYWSEKKDQKFYLSTEAKETLEVQQKMNRFVIQKDSLSHIFARIHLLGSEIIEDPAP